MKNALMVLCLLVLGVTGSTAQQGDRAELTGLYFGQEPPGEVPELFAPGIISVDTDFEHSAAVFSPDHGEVFWCTRRNLYSDEPGDATQRLYFMKRVDGKWTAPQLAPFTAHIETAVQRPVFSPDGSRLYIEYFSDPTRESDTDIYVVERAGEGWSEPAPVSPLINTRAMERLHCVTADGSLYFTRNLMMANEAVYVSRLVDGQFTAPEELGADYNSDAVEFVILITPDGSYMLTGQNRDRRSDELWISYRKADGSWSERIKTPYSCGGFLALSPDGEYLFLLGDGIYWISTSFVERLKPQDLD
ncbi:MAG: PD40 domain-containing protein [Candidatus Krumholzibacteriota bacterium]|nr:PD40 domain-containing protein [Candidatus Krumholzibacteriota bacterium]